MCGGDTKRDKKRQWYTTDGQLLEGIIDGTDDSKVSKPYSLTKTLFCLYKHTHTYAYVYYIYIQTMYHTVL